MKHTPKSRMLCAYRGLPSDRAPVAPEFWNYYPARVLGIPMIEFEREVPFWQSLQKVFTMYGCEGWGIAFPDSQNPNIEAKETMNGYRATLELRYKGKTFTTETVYDKIEPSWCAKHMASNLQEIRDVLEMRLDEATVYDFGRCNRAHAAVGEDYLLEMWLDGPFFDFVSGAAGFEKTVLYFADEDPQVLLRYRERYLQKQQALVRAVAEQTPFESFAIGCSYSCNSLIGRRMWRQWDKPYLQAILETIHSCGKVAHMHFHGKCMTTVADFVELGVDCVCPFERGPGGDVNTLEDLRKVRGLLRDKVTFNGNIHTVETLIRGTPEDARREVREVKEAFAGSNRYIIGTGDQVGWETKEENILAMIEEAKRTAL